MKLGLGMRKQQLEERNLLFLKQMGVTHAMVFMPDASVLPSAADGYWSYEDLKSLREHLERHGFVFEAIENFVPAHWHHILLDGPERARQMENIKKSIRNMGKAGIPIMGYNFSIGGVCGVHRGPYARGGAITAAYDAEEDTIKDVPIPYGFAWNTQIEKDVPQGSIGRVSEERMWDRLTRFLQEILPVAEEAGVQMAAHPEDPPNLEMRGVARLLVRPERYDRLFSIRNSDANRVEFCQGTFSEMPGVDIYEAIRKFAGMGKISYVHFRNVIGKLPKYEEGFIDEGDTDMFRAMR
ncbi:MAG TPA: D-mannonate dehydratase, partial [Clostridiales bacterium]|nr:D-mannonate dehydratase [Clostridiales bacterium]